MHKCEEVRKNFNRNLLVFIKRFMLDLICIRVKLKDF